MPTARALLAGEVINGEVYALGGLTGITPLATVEAYDPATDTWRQRAPMPTARVSLAAGVVNGVLYAVGGGTNSGQLSTLEAFFPPLPVPDIQANGIDDELVVTAVDPVNITVALYPGERAGDLSEGWIGAMSFGQTFWLTSSGWVASSTPLSVGQKDAEFPGGTCDLASKLALLTPQFL